ncbi:MAG: CoA transferase [Betaproteobacteria bacterium]|nr:CoA transferase [Betaproteobacteria bacterium]
MSDQSLMGVRVVELGSMITAPLAGMLLADLGADVIKVERPAGGDPFRNFRGGLYSAHFMAYNRNKRSMTLELKSKAGREIALKLIEQTDILIENYRPGVMERLGLDAQTLAAANPGLVHATITGFGPDGPYADRPSYDTVGLALSGMASLFVDDNSFDIRGPTFIDNVSGMNATYGILAALVRRGRTGKGGRVEVNMLEASIAFIPDLFANYMQSGSIPGPFSRVSTSQAYFFRCGDGKLLGVHLSSPTKFWDGLQVAMDSPELARDPRFATRMGRVENYVALRTALAAEFAKRERAYWIPRLEQHDVPHAPIHTIADVPNDPQVRHRGTFHDVQHPQMGTFTAIHNPVLIDGERQETRFAPPVLGEHTADILAALGYDCAACENLRAAGVIGA